MLDVIPSVNTYVRRMGTVNVKRRNSSEYISDTLFHFFGNDWRSGIVKPCPKGHKLRIYKGVLVNQELRLSKNRFTLGTAGAGSPYIQAELYCSCLTDVPLAYAQSHARQFGQCGFEFEKKSMFGVGAVPVWYVRRKDIIVNLNRIHDYLQQSAKDGHQVTLDKDGAIISAKSVYDNIAWIFSFFEKHDYYDEREVRIPHINKKTRDLAGRDRLKVGEMTQDGSGDYYLRIDRQYIKRVFVPDETYKYAVGAIIESAYVGRQRKPDIAVFADAVKQA